MTAPLDTNENVDIATQVATTAHGRKVLMMWHQPRAHIFFTPEKAFEFAEHIARSAHRAKFPGESLREDYSYLTQQVKQRLTEKMRDRLMIRVRTMLPSLLESKSLDFIARQVVDTIFSALDDDGEYKL